MARPVHIPQGKHEGKRGRDGEWKVRMARMPLRGATETPSAVAIWRRASFAHVPAAAVSDVARPCRLDGHLHTRHAQVPVLVRSRTREALERERYMRPKLLVNAIASEAR
jgi:hypothetical protein